MPGDRRGLLAAGLLVVGVGTAIFLVAANVIPQPDEKFGAPRWMVALFGLAFFFAGWYILSLLLPAPRTGQILGTAAALTLSSGGALFLTWLAWTGADAGRTTVSVGPFAMVLPPGVARGLDRAMVWFSALIADAIALVAWYQVLRWIVRRQAP